jgi:hypothetical protein
MSESRQLSATKSVLERYRELSKENETMNQEELLQICKEMQILLTNHVIEPVDLRNSEQSESYGYGVAYAAKSNESNNQLGMFIDYSHLKVKYDESSDIDIPLENQVAEFLEKNRNRGFVQNQFKVMTFPIAYPIPISRDMSIASRFTVLGDNSRIFEFKVLPFDFPGAHQQMQNILEQIAGKIGEKSRKGVYSLGEDGSELLVCIDRVFVASSSEESQRSNIEKLFQQASIIKLKFDIRAL